MPAATAIDYANDYTRYRNVVDCDYSPPNSDAAEIKGLKALFNRINQSDHQRVSSGLVTGGERRPVTIWNPAGQEFTPQPDGSLLLDDGERWILRQVDEVEHFGRWEATATLGRSEG